MTETKSIQLKFVVGLVASLVFSSVAGARESSAPLNAAKAASKDAATAKLDKWQDRFLPVCVNQSEKKMKPGEAKPYCTCMAGKHRAYAVKKLASEQTELDRHLAEVLEIYSSGEDADSDDEPSVIDLDIDLAGSCLPRSLKKRSDRSDDVH